MKRTEDGAALVLALVVVLLAGLLAGATASLIATTLRFSDNIEADRQATYAADGAADWAINQSELSQAAQGPPCVGGAPQLGAVISGIPSLAVQASPVGSPGDGSAFECTYTVSAGSVTYISADVEFFSPPASPLTVVKSWVDRPPQSGG